jgi:hypothetical protein
VKRKKRTPGIVVDEALLDSFRGPGVCSWCRKWVRRLDAAHVEPKGMGGWARIDLAINVLSLCRLCHQSHHDGNEPEREQLLATVAKREDLLQGEIVARVLELKRRSKGVPR